MIARRLRRTSARDTTAWWRSRTQAHHSWSSQVNFSVTRSHFPITPRFFFCCQLKALAFPRYRMRRTSFRFCWIYIFRFRGFAICWLHMSILESFEFQCPKHCDTFSRAGTMTVASYNTRRLCGMLRFFVQQLAEFGKYF